MDNTIIHHGWHNHFLEFLRIRFSPPVNPAIPGTKYPRYTTGFWALPSARPSGPVAAPALPVVQGCGGAQFRASHGIDNQCQFRRWLESVHLG